MARAIKARYSFDTALMELIRPSGVVQTRAWLSWILWLRLFNRHRNHLAPLDRSPPTVERVSCRPSHWGWPRTSADTAWCPGPKCMTDQPSRLESLGCQSRADHPGVLSLVLRHASK